MASKTQMRLQQLTGSIADLAYSGSQSSVANPSAIADNDLGGVLGQFAAQLVVLQVRTLPVLTALPM